VGHRASAVGALNPLHPDGGGAYTHNGPRRWESRSDPEWQMLAGWVRGDA